MPKCSYCGDKGVLKLTYPEDAEYFDVAVCTCKAGKFFRQPWQFRLWVARHPGIPGRTGRLEDLVPAEELATLKGEPCLSVKLP